eukprot:TRINITY_DN20444_c1_g1_i5.p1 TRINITY_DN20444_c1_g1~~TRINITY_DN20444_c1_g1_i5.p1  ORF type:complete len:279 (-),score=55.85 TRINITY_DN20444_c1_g1_i5:202-1038(-)
MAAANPSKDLEPSAPQAYSPLGGEGPVVAGCVVGVPAQASMESVTRCRFCQSPMPASNTFCGQCGKALREVPLEMPPGAQPSVTGTGGYWLEFNDIDMCRQGDMELILNWREHTTLDAMKKTVEEKGYSAITVSNGTPSFGHAALKKFDYQLQPSHCKPISTCCKHPCKIYIYVRPEGHVRCPEGFAMQGREMVAGAAQQQPFPGYISAYDAQGCWVCGCIPGGCACFQKVAHDNDSLLHKGIVFLLFAIPCPFAEMRRRHPGTNGFYKEGEANIVLK